MVLRFAGPVNAADRSPQRGLEQPIMVRKVRGRRFTAGVTSMKRLFVWTLACLAIVGIAGAANAEPINIRFILDWKANAAADGADIVDHRDDVDGRAAIACIRPPGMSDRYPGCRG